MVSSHCITAADVVVSMFWKKAILYGANETGETETAD
jgi:hypothetical protein